MIVFVQLISRLGISDEAETIMVKSNISNLIGRSKFINVLKNSIIIRFLSSAYTQKITQCASKCMIEGE